MKTCKTCNQEKPYTEYTKCKAAKDGYAYVCNPCRAAYEQKRRIASGIKPKPRPTVLGDKHKECLHCHGILHIDEFPISTRGRLYRAAYCKTCTKKYHHELRNDPAVREASKKATQRYRDNHRTRWRGLHRINQFKRRTNVEAQSDGTITDEFMEALYETTHCHWCHKYTPRSKRTAEHLIPLAKGGIHGISNLKMACRRCNSSKLNFK